MHYSTPVSNLRKEFIHSEAGFFSRSIYHELGYGAGQDGMSDGAEAALWPGFEGVCC